MVYPSDRISRIRNTLNPGSIHLIFLGRGAFATVRRALHRASGQWFACKVITKSRFVHNPRSRQMFEREVAIMKEFDHLSPIPACRSFEHDFAPSLLAYCPNDASAILPRPIHASVYSPSLEPFSLSITRMSYALNPLMNLFRLCAKVLDLDGVRFYPIFAPVLYTFTGFIRLSGFEGEHLAHFEDESTIWLILELISGGDLLEAVINENGLCEWAVFLPLWVLRAMSPLSWLLAYA
ncbi:Pkinase domain-containing protein [Rhizoctonia solani AG-1 IA]|uniref:Pkinase domain-containing protein n=1 Tax=Thanatephorus cucumeris (strain AG1-IA) TaxID=983506 RepID=L8WHJ8_THACA|nr:Pkinase domain-containing protein [Rhizoctonia solani AG-1 IA]